jgi:hypothetical protein
MGHTQQDSQSHKEGEVQLHALPRFHGQQEGTHLAICLTHCSGVLCAGAI